MEELFVVICVVSGDMTGEAWRELAVVTGEALMADGMEFVAEIGGRKDVCTLLGFVRRVVALEDWDRREVIVVDCGDIVDSEVTGELVANRKGESIL